MTARNPALALAAPCRPPATGERVFAPGAAAVQVRPKISARALEAHVSGCAGAKFHIGPTGAVRDVQLVAEYPLGYGFGEAAVKALSGFRYDPNPDPAKWFFVIEGMYVR